MRQVIIKGIVFLLMVCLLLGLAALLAVDRGGHLARQSDSVEQDIQAIEQRLSELASLHVSTARSHFGYYTAVFDTVQPGRPVFFTIDLGKSYPVDQVFLVPVLQVRDDGTGVAANNFLRSFRVSASETKAFSDPVVLFDHTTEDYEEERPYPVRIDCPSTMARYIRLEITRLWKDPASRVHHASLAEMFVFSGEENVALGKPIESTGNRDAGTFYSDAYVVDGRTQMGLPERRSETPEKLGWHAHVRRDRDHEAFVELRFPAPVAADALILYPARTRQLAQVDAYGFPENVQIMAQRPDGRWRSIADYTRERYPYPGANPAVFDLTGEDVEAIRIEAVQLVDIVWGYSLAFSEIEVLCDGENIAPGAAITTSPSHNDPRNWTVEALVDGWSSYGKLIGWRTWLNELSERQLLQDRLKTLQGTRKTLSGKIRDRLNHLMLGGIVVFIVVVAGFIAFVMVQRRQRQREVARVRERIAGDLHDEVGSNLGSIQILSECSAYQQPGPHDLKLIQMIAADTVTAVRDIVWLMRPGEHEPGSVVEHLKETGSILLESLETTFQVDDGVSLVTLSDERLRDLMLFYREALYNIVRHAQAKTVTVSLHVHQQELTLSIADNGCGIAPDRLDRPSTLRALKQRAERLGGRVQVESTVGEGTTLVLQIPFDSEHKI